MPDILYHVDYKEVCITLKKFIAVFLSLTLCTSIAGCTAGSARNSDGSGSSAVSSSDVSQQSELSQSDSLETGSSSGDISSFNAGSEISSIQSTSGYDKLMKELDELEQVLKSLDQLSEDDLEIPTP